MASATASISSHSIALRDLKGEAWCPISVPVLNSGFCGESGLAHLLVIYDLGQMIWSYGRISSEISTGFCLNFSFFRHLLVHSTRMFRDARHQIFGCETT